MSFTVFYAWQSDRDEDSCRYLIRNALRAAIKSLKADATVKDAPTLDHDTKDEPGTPHIALSIQRKIKHCGVFVADLTFATTYTTRDGRTKFAPNSNVLIELGLAILYVGWERIILVMNVEHGKPEDLPFDLRHRRAPIAFNLSETASVSDLKAARSKLCDSIATSLKLMIASGVIERANVQKRKRADEEDRKLLEAATAERQSVERAYALNDEYKEFEAEAALVFSIVPLRPPVKLIDLESHEQSIRGSLRPLGATGWHFVPYGHSRVLHDGTKPVGTKPTPPMALSEITDRGCVFAFQDVPRGDQGISILSAEREVYSAASPYVSLLRRLGITGPLLMGVTLTGAAGYGLALPRSRFWRERHEREFSADTVTADFVRLEEMEAPTAQKLRSAFEYIWREAGHARDPLFNEAGALIE